MSKKNFKVYKSSAGSGKTFTLSKTFLRLILSSDNPLYFRHILAITFTVKAAAEMKDRIISYLSALAGNPSNRKDVESMRSTLMSETILSSEEITIRSKRALEALIHNYGDFSILTIDKFVHRLVRSFASDLGMSPDFEVEIDQSRLIDLVTKSLLDKVGKDEGITKLVMQFVETQTETDKSWDIEPQLADLAKELSSEDFFINGSNLQSIGFDEASNIISALKEEVNDFEHEIESIGKEAFQLTEKHGLDISDFASGRNGIHSFFKKLQDPSIFYKGDLVTKTLEKILDNDNLASKASGNPELVNSLFPPFRKLIDRFFELEKTLPQIKFKKNMLSSLFGMVLINELKQVFDQVKQEENVQTLSDFNQILTQHFVEEQTPFIYEKLGARYQNILIDEFQDTSTLQWINLQPLVENSLAEGKESLIVGDAKQSIYRFRGSEPEQFMRLPKTHGSAQNLLADSYQEHKLLTNYRSAQNIVNFNNQFFKELSEAVLSKSHLPVFIDLEQQSISGEPGEVRVHLLDRTFGDEKFDEYYDSIKNRLEQLRLEDESALGKTCILFRQNAEASKFAARLIQDDFEVISEESLLIDNSAEVQLILSTLYASRFPTDPFHLQKWLSKLFQFNKLKEDYHPIAQTLKKNKLSFDELSRHLKINLEQRKLEQGDSFSKVFEICRIFDLEMNNPFVARFLDFALDYEQSNLYLKHTFLDYYETKKSGLSVILAETGNAIQIMTIHKSKGLEFEHVLIYMPEIKQGEPTKSYSWFQNGEIITGLEHYFLPIKTLADTPFQKLYDSEINNSWLDKLNTYYVAFTRAEKTLDVFTFETEQKSGTAPHGFIKKWKVFNKERNMLEIIGQQPAFFH